MAAMDAISGGTSKSGAVAYGLTERFFSGFVIDNIRNPCQYQAMKHIAIWFSFALALCTAPPATRPAWAAESAACSAAMGFTFPRLQDEKPQSLCQYSGKVALVVNTASFCGFTPQYKGLEALYARYKDKGLVVLGFPSNDFSQESGSNKDIADFCENTFGVKFPMFSKSSVTGAQANPLFKQLAKTTGAAPGWNFHKYLISRDGRSVTSFNSQVDPEDRAFINAVEKLLAAK
jgi:glutathione peroxidase